MNSPLPSRESVAIDLALAEVDLSDAPLGDILATARLYVSGELMTADEARRKANAELSKWESDRGLD